MKYAILTDFNESELLQNEILNWYKIDNDVNADRWSDVNKHYTSDIWAVPVPDNYETDLELFNELPLGWYEVKDVL